MNGVGKSALIIAAGGFAAKIIGAIYRVPLTNIIGAEGIGLYQTVFPLYCALLTVSATGVPTALSGIIASSPENGKRTYVNSVLLFGGIGLVGSVIMFVLGDLIAFLQGNIAVGQCYRALSPSVFFSSVISVCRGYFQGRKKMYPTAISQIIEQVVKAVVGVGGCIIFKGSALLSATVAVLGVTLSELIALVFLLVLVKKEGERAREKPFDRREMKNILKVTVPVSLTALALPLGHVADSFIVLNALRGTENATSFFGLYSGSVAGISGVPVALAYGVAAAIIPSLSEGGQNKKIADSMRFTGFIAIPCGVYFLFFGNRIIDFLYPSLTSLETRVAGGLMSLEGICSLLLCFVQTFNAVLVGRGQQKKSVRIMFILLAVRTALVAALTPIIGIRGASIASAISYFVALAMQGVAVFNREIFSSLCVDTAKIFALSIVCCAVSGGIITAMGGRIGFAVAMCVGAALYLLIYLPLFGISLGGRLTKKTRLQKPNKA